MSKATLQFCKDICFTLDGRGKLVICGNEYRIMFLAKGRWWFWHQWAKVYALPRYRSIGHGKRVRIGYGALEWMLKHLHSEEFRDKRRRMMRPITLRIVPDDVTPAP